MMQEIKNYYNVLGVPRNASDEEIKNAFRSLVKTYHPDKNPGDITSEEKFKEVYEAYHFLSNKQKKQELDELLNHMDSDLLGLNDLGDFLNQILSGDIKKGQVHVTKSVIIAGVEVSRSEIYDNSLSDGFFKEKIKVSNGKTININPENCSYLNLGISPNFEDDCITFDNQIIHSNQGLSSKLNLLLPLYVNFNLNINFFHGVLKGYLAHNGKINAYGSNLNLHLYGEIGLDLINNNKSVDVLNMKLNQNGLYVPKQASNEITPKRIVNLNADQCKGSITYKE